MIRPLVFLVSLAVWLTPQAPVRSLSVIEPTADSVLEGRSTLSVEVQPSTMPVQYVAFFVDGEQVCRASARPFQCSFDAGVDRGVRTVRVVAEFADGERIVQSLRTRSAPASNGLVFRARTDAVLVPVQVTDGRGHFVRDLEAREFRVLENGQPQTITGLASEDTPASVLLALDISASMRPALNNLKSAADAFLHGLRPTDVAAVAAFNEGLFVIARPGTDRLAQGAAVDRLDVSGRTALYDSVVKAVDLIKTLPSPRVLVFFTDGDDTASRGTSEAARMALQLNDVVLYLVVQGDTPKKGTSRDLLTAVAQETGGGAWFSHHMSQLREQFVGIVDDFTHRYVLTYKPGQAPGDGSWRTITVQVIGRHGNYSLRYRQAYPALRKDGAIQ